MAPATGRWPNSSFQHFLRLPLSERIEHVVVAGRGVVAEDQGERVEVEASQVVDPAADPLAVAPAFTPFTAVGVVAGHGAAVEQERRPGIVEHPAAEPIAAIAAAGTVAAEGVVVADVRVEGGRGAAVPEAAPRPEPALPPTA